MKNSVIKTNFSKRCSTVFLLQLISTQVKRSEPLFRITFSDSINSLKSNKNKMVYFQKELAKAKEFFYKQEIKWTVVIRSTIYMICCGVMLYQVYSSCTEYYKYNTVVQIKIAKPVDQDMPAISVCRQITVTEYLDLLRKNDQQFAEKHPAQSTQTTSSPLTEEDEEKKEWAGLAQLASFFQLPNKSSRDLFNAISESLKVECKDVRSGTGPDCYMSAFPIHSFNHKRICVTFFSKLYINYNFSENNFNISENNGTEKEEDRELLLAWLKIDNPTNDSFVYIHTSKSMPDINLYDLEMTRSRLFSSQTYGVIYHRYWVRRLEDPYITKCYSYKENRATEMDPLSEFGCISQCKKRYWINETTDSCIPIDLVYIIESGDSAQNICNCTVKKCDNTLNTQCIKCPQADSEEYKTYSKNCEDNCLQDCYEEYYQKDMFELKDDFKNKIWTKYEISEKDVSPNQTLVFLAAKYHEEMSYTHVPKATMFDFFGLLGGLFSLWIGASVMTIYDVLLFLFKFTVRAHKTFKLTKDKLGQKLQNQIKIRGEMRKNRNIYGHMNSGRVRRIVHLSHTLPNLSDYY